MNSGWLIVDFHFAPSNVVLLHLWHIGIQYFSNDLTIGEVQFLNIVLPLRYTQEVLENALFC
jgi:hypothetical protein